LKNVSIGLNIAWQIAAVEASGALHEYLKKEHMLIGICSLEKASLPGSKQNFTYDVLRAMETEGDAIKNVLSSFELSSQELRREIRKRVGEGSSKNAGPVMHRDFECKQVFARAESMSGASGDITCLHFLAALMDTPGSIIAAVLEEKRTKPVEIAKQAIIYQNRGKSGLTTEKASTKTTGNEQQTPSGTHYLDKYGRDLTEEAKNGKLGPFIGRRTELLQLIQTIARKSKNNPVLVGEAGVGKTAIVEALAIRVAQGKDPQILQGKRIIELNIGGLVAGTMYRGEFEQRLTKIIEEVRVHPEIIVFIDEIHNLIGAGRAEGSTDAANLMKPALARGEIRCIGATTIAEYRRYIESDPALERRFEKVIVNEPSPHETFEILKGIKVKLQEYHDVEILDSAIEAAVNLSIRFDVDHQLPDKAIDLVDKASARARVPGLSWEGEKEGGDSKGKMKPVVDDNAIAKVLSDKIAVPVEILTGHLEGIDQNSLVKLKSTLREKLIGQEEAIERVCNRLILAQSGLDKRRGPLSVFLFLGPTGVGKTELAKILAEGIFGNKSDMIRVDMSEYMEEHSVAKLIGSPPGYVGYEAEGQLTGKLRTRPYSIVLLDEIEKAHPRVLDMFLQVFDDGRLTDAKGRTIDAGNAIFIMTSNIKSGNFADVPSIYDGRKPKSESIREKLSKVMRPELINRITEIIEFRLLTTDDVKKILRLQLNELIATVNSKQGINLTIDQSAEDFLAKSGFSNEFGVRELQRIVEEQLEIPLSRLIISSELKKHICWKITYANESIQIIPQNLDSKTIDQEIG
jgi:ATP-dependent Clp protease ATP-binding subunit ClpC